MKKIDEISTSGKQDLPKTLNGSTSPVHQERIVQQENTNGELHLTCRKDPEHNGEWRCTQDPGPVVQKAVSSLTTLPVDTLSSTSDERDSRTAEGKDIETWTRGNGEVISVRQIEHKGKVLYEPVNTISQPQPADQQPHLMKATKQDPSVGRTQLCRCGEGSKSSHKLPGIHHSTRERQSDQTTGGT